MACGEMSKPKILSLNLGARREWRRSEMHPLPEQTSRIRRLVFDCFFDALIPSLSSLASLARYVVYDSVSGLHLVSTSRDGEMEF